MAIAIGAIGAVSSGSGTAATTSAPAGGSTGDLLRLTVLSSSSTPPTTPDGWTLEGARIFWFGSFTISTYYRDKGNATGSDTPTVSVPSGAWRTQIVRATGWDGAAPDDVVAPGGDISADPFNITDGTCTVDGSMAFTSFASSVSTARSVTAAPAGYELFSAGAQNYCFHGGYLAVDSGSVGGGDWDCDGGIRFGYVLGIYNPSVGGGGTVLEADGVGVGAGTAHLTLPTRMSATGPGVGAGGAALTLPTRLAAAGGGVGAGAAALRFLQAFGAAGVGIGAGSANLTVGGGWSAVGAGVGSGAATLRFVQRLVAPGPGIGAGTAHLRFILQLVASGAGVGTGTAALVGSFEPIPILYPTMLRSRATATQLTTRATATRLESRR
jgi:hypothetical protein